MRVAVRMRERGIMVGQDGGRSWGNGRCSNDWQVPCRAVQNNISLPRPWLLAQSSLGSLTSGAYLAYLAYFLPGRARIFPPLRESAYGRVQCGRRGEDWVLNGEEGD